MKVRWLIALAMVGGLLAQAPPAGAPTGAGAVPPSYIVGPNDVLSMSVFGDTELDATGLRVDVDGTVHIPYGSTPVKLAGLTAAQASQVIAAALVKDQLAVNPRVEVVVVAPESHPVVISGQGLRSPGTIQAIRPIPLLDALAEVGGLATTSANSITIVRHGPDGKPEEQRFTAGEVYGSTSPLTNPLLYGGEEVRVMPVGDVYLTGGVNSPGAYPLSDNDPLTVRKVMAMAKGIAPAAKADQAELIHHAGQANQSVSVIDLPKILTGKLPDVTLAANDMLYVPVSGTKKSVLDFASRTAAVLTTVAGAVLAR